MGRRVVEVKAGVFRGAILAVVLALVSGCIARSGPGELSITKSDSDLAGFTLIKMAASDVGNYGVIAAADVPGAASIPAVPRTTLSSGDVLRIRISETKDGAVFAPLASGGTSFDNVRIDYKGAITLPYVGHLKVAGLDPPAIQDAIRQRLEGVTIEPQVYVEIVSDRGSSVLVSGEVHNPGRFSMLEGPLTLIDAIAKAGGSTQPPYQVDVVIRHGKSVRRIPLERVLNGDNQALRPGDEIILERQSKVFNAMGALQKTGQIDFPKANPSLMDALAQAGGLSDTRANNKGVFVFRSREPKAWRDADNRWQEGPVIFQFDLSKPEMMFVAQAFGIRNGDTIYVTNAPSIEWTRAVAPIAVTLATVRGAVSTQNVLGRDF